jgi:hypothetical protein
MTELEKELANSCRELRAIVIAEFSYDGEDEHGVKTYQDEVDRAAEVVKKAEAA